MMKHSLTGPRSACALNVFQKGFINQRGQNSSWNVTLLYKYTECQHWNLQAESRSSFTVQKELSTVPHASFRLMMYSRGSPAAVRKDRVMGAKRSWGLGMA